MRGSREHLRWLPLVALFFVVGAVQAVAEEQLPPPTLGKMLFVQHCSACHGSDGRGAGPAAGALKTAPPDLTQLRRTHEGKFPFLRVVAFIDGERPVPAHGSREMPIWGHVFRWKEGDTAAKAQVYALAQYIESIQRE